MPVLPIGVGLSAVKTSSDLKAIWSRYTGARAPCSIQHDPNRGEQMQVCLEISRRLGPNRLRLPFLQSAMRIPAKPNSIPGCARTGQ